jgi:hypothetical protein
MAAKILWMYWHQGFAAAPELVKLCAASWAAKNPDYEIRLLDQRSAAGLVSLPTEITLRRRDLTIQKYSNILRLALLSTYGGVWADATLYCNRPLGDWLDEYAASGFFAFRNEAADRMLSSWFIAAKPDNLLLRRWAERHLAFFTENRFSNQFRPLGRFFIRGLSPRWNADYRSTAHWLSWFTRKFLRVYPYYIFHYIFNRLALADRECADQWNAVKPCVNTPVRQLSSLAQLDTGIEQARVEISSGMAPMYKLNWRTDISSPYWMEVLRRLREWG